jgi:cleavage and polyadenylation specificity factor subunit 5
MTTQQTLTLFPLSSYTFTTKAAQPEEDPSVAARLQRLQNQYEDLGIRHTAEGVLVVHDHGHPHVLMIQIANAFFKLPGNYLRPAEEETSGLARRLDEQLAPVEEDPNSFGPGGMSAGSGGDWEIGDCLAQWWRPSFETFMVRAYLAEFSCLAMLIFICLPRSIPMCHLTLPKRKSARSSS